MGWGYLRPVQFLDHLTVIKIFIFLKEAVSARATHTGPTKVVQEVLADLKMYMLKYPLHAKISLLFLLSLML